MEKENNQKPEGQKSPEEQKDQEINRKEFLRLSLRSLISGSLGLFSFLSSTQKAVAECDCEDVCEVDCAISCEDYCLDPCQYKCQDTCQDRCQEYCELDCEDQCEDNCEDTCQVSCQSHSWQNIGWNHNENQHWMVQRCTGCGATRNVNYGSHSWVDGNSYSVIPGDNVYHDRAQRCSVCSRNGYRKELHITDADHIVISYENDDIYGQANAEITCNKCGHITHDNGLPALFSHKLSAGQPDSEAYGSLVDADIFTADDPATPFYSTADYFPYPVLRGNTDETNTSYNPAINVPFIYIARDGRLKLGLKQAEIDAYFAGEMRLIYAYPHQQLAKTASDKLYLKMKVEVEPEEPPLTGEDPPEVVFEDQFVLFYERNYETGEVTLFQAVLDSLNYTDEGDYTLVKTIEFMEENHNGVIRYFNISFRFCDIYPDLILSATDGSRLLEDAGAGPGSRPDEANTVYSKYQPQFNLDFNCNKGVLGEHDWVLNPLSWHRDNINGGETFRLNRLESGTPGFIKEAATPGSYAGAPDDLQFVLNRVTAYDEVRDAITAEGHNVNFVAKYALEVTARNIVGNVSTATFYFYLDDGVEADPVISWAYHLPVIVINNPDQRVFGKETFEEIDFELLNTHREAYQISSINVYDEDDFRVEEGFRGPVAVSAPNKSGVFILKDPDGGTDESNLIPAVTSGLQQDTEYGNRAFHQVTLTLGDFLNKNTNPEDREYKTSKYILERIVGEPGAEVYVRREIDVPVNIWNIPFRTKILVRDWIGNEKVTDAVVCDNPAFTLALTGGSIYTPAYCPDVDITTVYITGTNNEIQTNPQLAVNPPAGTLVEVTFLPCFRAFSSDYYLRVEEPGGRVVFPESVFNTRGGPALVTGLGYGYDYNVFIKVRNANGYVSVPENAFRYTFTRSNLTITRSGVLTGDEIWNWRYRLIGDIIIPWGIRLSIFPGGGVLMPKMPAVFADKRSKIMVKTGGTLVIDGSLGTTGSFDPEMYYLDKDQFINLTASGLDSRLGAGGLPETVYAFDGENNWGGIYFEAGYNRASYIKRARIGGAYDGVLVFGGNTGGSGLAVSESVLSGNYIGIHCVSPGRIHISDTIIDANLEYGIKTEGSGYIIVLAGAKKTSPPNRFADYYSTRLFRRLSFDEVQNDAEIKNVEEGAN